MPQKKQKQIRLNEYDLLNSIVNDDALVSGMTESLIIEDIIAEHYINPKYGDCIRCLYEQNASIGTVLSYIWIAVLSQEHEDLLDLVKYAGIKTKMCMGFPDTNNPEWHHFMGLMESLGLYFQTAIKKNNDRNLVNDKAWLDDLYSSYEKKDTTTGFYPVYQLIINHWDYLKDKIKVYNLLQSMAELQTGWLNLPSDRIELLRTLKKIK